MDESANPVQKRISELVKRHEVLLFMKGKRAFPQCGFSSTVVGMLDELIDEYHTVNVLDDPEIRSGAKEFSDWPTFPQLYVGGEFVGGCDITKAMYSNGELHSLLGIQLEAVEPPQLTVTAAANRVLSEAARNETHKGLRLEINRRFQYGLSFGPRNDSDIVVETAGLKFLFDRGSAKRANGMTIDYVADAGGFRIENPNEPASVAQITPATLKSARDADAELRLIDVRPDTERAISKIDGDIMLTAETRAELVALPKDTPLYFYCRSGARSLKAAEEFVREGFTHVHNLDGGVNRWALEVDPTLTRY